jgi:hypothetical protein
MRTKTALAAMASLGLLAGCGGEKAAEAPAVKAAEETMDAMGDAGDAMMDAGESAADAVAAGAQDAMAVTEEAMTPADGQP